MLKAVLAQELAAKRLKLLPLGRSPHLLLKSLSRLGRSSSLSRLSRSSSLSLLSCCLAFGLSLSCSLGITLGLTLGELKCKMYYNYCAFLCPESSKVQNVL